VGETAIATKWLKRIAQGFSPGFVEDHGCALKGRPKKGLCLPTVSANREFEAWPGI
jgi:hypothetical protein